MVTLSANTFFTILRVRICVLRWAEQTKAGSEATEAGFSTIDQVGRERIIRAANKIRIENLNITADLGYRHYTLAEPTSIALDKIEAFNPDDNGMFDTNTIMDEFGASTVLTTWLVRDGYGFTAPVQTVDFDGYTAYYLEKHLYLINPNLTEKAISVISAKYETDGEFNPENVALFGYSFTWTELESQCVHDRKATFQRQRKQQTARSWSWIASSC